mgnify:CR=1 FL=1
MGQLKGEGSSLLPLLLPRGAARAQPCQGHSSSKFCVESKNAAKISACCPGCADFGRNWCQRWSGRARLSARGAGWAQRCLRLRRSGGGAAGQELKASTPAAAQRTGSTIQGIPSFIWGLPLALPPGRGSSLGSKLPGLCSAAERRAAAPAARLGPWEHGWVQHASGDPPFLWGFPLILPLNGKALLGLLRRGCSSLSRWPQCLAAEARGQKHPASGDPLFPLGEIGRAHV